MGVTAALEALEVLRATLVRRSGSAMEPAPVLPDHRALGGEVYAELRSMVHGERFVNKAPADDHGTLLNDGSDLCPAPTTVRLLRRCQR